MRDALWHHNLAKRAEFEAEKKTLSLTIAKLHTAAAQAEERAAKALVIAAAREAANVADVKKQFFPSEHTPYNVDGSSMTSQQ